MSADILFPVCLVASLPVTPPRSSRPMALLCDLPDEVLLEIVRALNAIRSFETQSTAFRNKHVERERQRENHIRQQSLYTLCLTSHRFRSLSLPTLYASSTTCATEKGLKQLQLLHRTLREDRDRNAPNHTRPLCEYVLYVENRLADHEGSSLGDDPDFQDKHLPTYQRDLSSLVQLASNIEHLCVVSLEADAARFWGHILHDIPLLNADIHTKLRCLYVQIHAVSGSFRSAPIPNDSITKRFMDHAFSFPSLLELGVSSVEPVFNPGLNFRPGGNSSLQRLDINVTILGLQCVAAIVLACTNLQELVCELGFYRGAEDRLSVLHSALLARANTLRRLTLDWSGIIDSGDSILGSLRSLKNLESLEISEVGFLCGARSASENFQQPKKPTLSSLLPESLKQITLFCPDLQRLWNNDDGLDTAHSLRQFASECIESVPHLEKFWYTGDLDDAKSKGIEKEFEKVGVQFRALSDESYTRLSAM